MKHRRADFELQNEGTLFVLYPRTKRAVAWTEENLPGDATHWAGGTVIEHRYVEDIVVGFQLDGLTLKRA